MQGVNILHQYWPVFVAAPLYLLLFVIISKYSSKEYTRRSYMIALTASFVFTAVMALCTPFSPSYDAYEMLVALNFDISGFDGGLSTYYTFWASNKLAFLIYRSFVLPFGVINGVRICNYVLCCGFIFFISQISGCVSGKSYKAQACVIATALTPFVIMTGPYIYAPSLFMSSAAIWLLLFIPGQKRMIVRITSAFILFLIIMYLFVMRMTACIQIFVLAFFLIIKGLKSS